MRNIFCTADVIGTETGGGVVTKNEAHALESLGQPMITLDATNSTNPASYKLPNSPYIQDYLADATVLQLLSQPVGLAHFYSGMFSKTIWRLKASGARVTQTIAAHDMELSAQEFARYGMAYDFPHLTNPVLWQTYVEGQLMADRVICPSTASAEIVKRYGVRNPVVIPHGCNPPAREFPLPRQFNVGYLGQCGPDKGLVYLLEAWSRLNLKNCRLILSGRGIDQMVSVWHMAGGKGEVEFMGEASSPSDLFEKIALYVQPSVTEGFGIPVLEAMSHRRPCIVSDGAGAADVISHGINGYVFPKRDVDMLCSLIMRAYSNFSEESNPEDTDYGDPYYEMMERAQETALEHTWDKIIPRYHKVWNDLVGAKEPS